MKIKEKIINKLGGYTEDQFTHKVNLEVKKSLNTYSSVMVNYNPKELDVVKITEKINCPVECIRNKDMKNSYLYKALQKVCEYIIDNDMVEYGFTDNLYTNTTAYYENGLEMNVLLNLLAPKGDKINGKYEGIRNLR